MFYSTVERLCQFVVFIAHDALRWDIHFATSKSIIFSELSVVHSFSLVTSDAEVLIVFHSQYEQKKASWSLKHVIKIMVKVFKQSVFEQILTVNVVSRCLHNSNDYQGLYTISINCFLDKRSFKTIWHRQSTHLTRRLVMFISEDRIQSA